MTNDYGVEIQCEPQLCTIPLEEYESLKKRIAELEASLQKERDFGLHIARCADHDIEKLTSENARLKAQVPKWHSANCFDDDLPTRSDMFCVLFHTAEGKLYRSACYYFADEDGDSRFGEWEFDGVEKWCELPLPPPPTEESSETEKDG